MGYTSERKCIQIEISDRFNLIHEKEWTVHTVSIICKRYDIFRKNMVNFCFQKTMILKGPMMNMIAPRTTRGLLSSELNNK